MNAILWALSYLAMFLIKDFFFFFKFPKIFIVWVKQKKKRLKLTFFFSFFQVNYFLVHHDVLDLWILEISLGIYPMCFLVFWAFLHDRKVLFLLCNEFPWFWFLPQEERQLPEHWIPVSSFHNTMFSSFSLF